MIESRGTLHIVGMDVKTVKEIAHSLVITNKHELALDLLMKCSFNTEGAREFIQSVAMQMTATPAADLESESAS